MLAVILTVSLVATSGAAEARDRTTKSHTTTTTTSDRPVESRMSAPDRAEHSSGSTTFGLGVSSITAVSSGGSITGIIAFTPLDLVQVLVSIPSTTGSFQFGVGGIYKRTVAGNQGAGFHIGGGAGLGMVSTAAAQSDFGMNIFGVLGVHYAPGGSNIVFHLDGGPQFNLQKVSTGTGAAATSTTNTSFSMNQLSSLLGASVVYMF